MAAARKRVKKPRRVLPIDEREIEDIPAPPLQSWWDYRVFVKEEQGEDVYTIREAHHRCTKFHAPDKCPSPKTHLMGYTGPTEPVGSYVWELETVLRQMLRATEASVIRLDESDNVVKPPPPPPPRSRRSRRK